MNEAFVMVDFLADASTKIKMMLMVLEATDSLVIVTDVTVDHSIRC